MVCQLTLCGLGIECLLIYCIRCIMIERFLYLYKDEHLMFRHMSGIVLLTTNWQLTSIKAHVEWSIAQQHGNVMESWRMLTWEAITGSCFSFLICVNQSVIICFAFKDSSSNVWKQLWTNSRSCINTQSLRIWVHMKHMVCRLHMDLHRSADHSNWDDKMRLLLGSYDVCFDLIHGFWRQLCAAVELSVRRSWHGSPPFE